MKTVYLLFQTDLHKSKSSRVLFGCFSSYEKAEAHAERKKIATNDSLVCIEKLIINKFAEA